MPTETIIIRSPPQAQGRPRFSVRGSHAFVWNPHKDKANWARLQISSQVNEKISSPIRLKVVYFLAIPKATSKKKRVLMLENEIKHQKLGDIDNFLKFTLDAMNNIVFDDDKQVWSVDAEKRYSDDPRTEIIVYY